MTRLSSKEIGVPFIISLIINLLFGYLVAIQKISLTVFIFILVGSIIVIIIMGIQLKTNESEQGLTELKEKVKSMEEKLIIYQRLIILEERINSIEKRAYNGKK